MQTYGWTACVGCDAPMPPGGPTTGSVIGKAGYACPWCVRRRVAEMDRMPTLRCVYFRAMPPLPPMRLQPTARAPVRQELQASGLRHHRPTDWQGRLLRRQLPPH
jgi:hypothetical protein